MKGIRTCHKSLLKLFCFLYKVLVIDYGEGGGGYKMGKSRVRNFLSPPPPSKHGQTLYAPPPHFKGWKPFVAPPPPVWLKCQPPVLALPQNLLSPPPPFRMTKTVPAHPPPPFFFF